MITIAIPTYNRYGLLKLMAASLYSSDLSVPYNIRIYDDCSTEYGLDELKQLFPNAASINRNTVNLMADKNIYSFYVDFLSTSDNYLFNADSDFLFNKNWLITGLELLEKTEGVLSLFNATSHPSIEVIGNTFCTKEHIGSAGTLFTKDRVKNIVNYFSEINDPGNYSFDWKWSEYFRQNNVRIFCTNNSLVQHIGYTGQNTLVKHRPYKGLEMQKPFFDFGRNFKVDSLETGQIINNIFEQFIDQNRNEDERIINLMAQRPISRIKKFIKKMILDLFDNL